MIFGIDYAIINEYIKDYAALKPALDFQFAFYRLTQGYNIYDHVLTIKAADEQARDNGLLTAGWHQFDPTQSVPLQMDNFCRSWEAVKTFELRPILAVESGNIPAWAAVPARVQADMIEQCVEILATRIHSPMIYTRKEYWDSHVEARPTWAALPLWAARYIPINTRQAPTLLSPWADGAYKFRDWTNNKGWFWQYTDTGWFPGLVVSPINWAINARIDLDAFDGTRADLEALKISPPAPAVDLAALQQKVITMGASLDDAWSQIGDHEARIGEHEKIIEGLRGLLNI